MMGSEPSEKIDRLHEEDVIDEQPARYIRGLLRARGKLFLTDRQLIFRPAKNWIGPSVAPISFELERISAIGRRSGSWIVSLFLLGQNADSWFVQIDGRRYWFDLGAGWNKMWSEKFA